MSLLFTYDINRFSHDTAHIGVHLSVCLSVYKCVSINISPSFQPRSQVHYFLTIRATMFIFGLKVYTASVFQILYTNSVCVNLLRISWGDSANMTILSRVFKQICTLSKVIKFPWGSFFLEISYYQKGNLKGTRDRSKQIEMFTCFIPSTPPPNSQHHRFSLPFFLQGAV